MRTLVTTKEVIREPAPAELKTRLAAAAREGFWLDIEGTGQEEVAMLADVFKFHPLTLEDVQHQNQRPKLEEYPGYSFVVLFLADWGEGEELALAEQHLYLGPDYLVSIHRDPSSPLSGLQERLHKSPELARGKGAFLTYLVVDGLIDALFPVLDRLDEMVDTLEDEIVQRAQPAVLNRIYHLKHEVTELRRLLGAQRDLFQRLVTHSLDLLSEDMTLYYRDVFDHIVRQYEAVDSLRDLLTSAMDVYLSTVSNRLNQTMKALTVIASLFLPLSFLTGFYGMNFAFLTGVLEPPYLAFWIGVGTMLVAIGVQLWFFRRRGWI